jgi:hypothetical protein
MSKPLEIPEDQISARLAARGIECDAERARALRPLAGSLLGRLARFADALPREAAPPPLGTLDPGGEREP